MHVDCMACVANLYFAWGGAVQGLPQSASQLDERYVISQDPQAAEYSMQCYSLSTRCCLPGLNAVHYIATGAMASSTCFSTCFGRAHRLRFRRNSIVQTLTVSWQQPRHSAWFLQTMQP